MSDVDLEQAAARAVEAALAAGASDAEAWAEEGVEREIRVYEGAVESLTDAGEPRHRHAQLRRAAAGATRTAPT